MARKKTNTPRKRKRLKANPKRQAHAQLRGYLYQIWHSVDAWLDLADDDILYLEGAEDLDIISEDTATAVQVKDTRHNITLRYQEVNDAINHYWELQDNHPKLTVKFRFLTRSKIVVEKGNLFGNDQSGLQLWSRCSGNETAITKISDFLQNEGKISTEVNDFLKQASPQEIYEKLIEPITWETGSKPISYVEQSICKKLVYHGDRYSIPHADAQKVVDHLLKEALTVATQEENRELTREHFLKIFAENTRISIPIQNTRAHQPIQLKAVLNHIKEALIADSPDINIAIQSPIQDTIPPLYPNVTQRIDLLTNIQTKLQSESIVIIQGGVDTGKTTLAKLTANDINSDWFWLKFTNKDAPQIVQRLHQLDIEVSNRSSQVNVVLDDLSLQPPDLQEYEEDLGIAIYRLLERGAKLLITSQHKPPNNLIRNLGVSSSGTIKVYNFTESEIEQFAEEMGCPADRVKDWTKLIQAHTGGHPRLVHARLVRLQEEGWNEQNIFANILQPPEEIVEEREEARQLLTDLPEDQQEFLYRLSLMVTEFRKDYALNIGEIPDCITHPGHIFNQLVGPWIDQVDERYYTISPLLTNAAKEDLSASRIKDLHAYIANAILKTKKLTTIEVWAVLTHSMVGQNKGGIISVVHALMTAPQNDWEKLSQEFSWLVSIKIDPHEELFPGDAFINQMFRSLQYRIAVEVEPEFAPKILEIWDKETKPYEPRQSYLLSRLMLATQALRYNQVPLTANKLIGYLKYIIETTDNHKDVGEMYFNSYGQFEESNIDNSNFFSFLFSFIYTRPSIYAPFLSDLIDALDGLQPKTRKLLLADFEDDNIESRLLIDGVWWAEANREKPNWTRCLQVFDRVIEKTIEWGYPHIAAASARGKAIIHDEYLKDPDTAHEVLQDIISKVGALPVVEEAQAVVYFNQKRYKDTLNIYERILPKWNPPSEQLNLGPLEEYRRAAICAASLNDWKKAATFLEEGAKKTQEIENTERYIGSYADAGFAHFKAGNMLDSIKLLNLALQKFEMLPQDNTDVKYFTLKKRLEHTIKWIWMIWHGRENNSSKPLEPPVGFCSDPETKEEFLTLPDCPTGYSWLHLAEIEYKFGHGTSVFQHALQSSDRKEYPLLNYRLSFLEAKYEFRNKTLDNLLQRIHQLVPVYNSMKKHQQSGKGAGEKGIYSTPITDLFNFASVENIVAILVAALLVQMRTNRNGQEILAIWRTNASELPKKKNVFTALDLIESILLKDQNRALTMMKAPDAKVEKRLTAALKVVQNKEANPANLFYAHVFITTSFINSPWEDFVVTDLAELLSAQWLEKIKSGAMSLIHVDIVQQIEEACNSSETSKKKIGQILLAAYLVASTMLPSDILQQLRGWSESESKQKHEPTTGKNPTSQRLIEAMEKPPHLTHEDVDALHQSIEEGKIPIKFDSPFEPDEHEKE